MAIRISGSKRVNRNSFDVVNLVDAATPGGQQPDGQSGWTLVMSDEFNGSMSVTDSILGRVKFRTDGPSWSTWYPEWQMFVDDNPTAKWHTNTSYEAYYDTSKVSLDGAGSLLLKCDKETSIAGLDYTAGMIQSIPFHTTTYGFYEARIKIQTASVQGHWPAFWLTASPTNTWPPEIDIWEYFWQGTQFSQNSYVVGDMVALTTNAPSALTNWHTYGCAWQPGYVRFYVDGVQTNQTTSVVPFTAQYLILNNGARTPGVPTFNSNDMWVDYVRVWQ